MDGWMDGARWKCRFEVKVWRGWDGMGWGVVVKWGVGDGEGWVRGGGIGGEEGWSIHRGEGEEIDR